MASSAERYEKKRASVNGLTMAYVETGEGDPIVLLHGNPTSSYLWRNVIPHVEGLGRCVAPDLIGMGDSDKLPESGPESYTFVQHREYVDALLEQLGATQNVTLVVHDWGSALGFDWAYRHQDAVRGIAYMEAILLPPSLDGLPDQVRQMFVGLRSPAGEQMVLEQNMFVEQMLPGAVMRGLTDEEMEVYRRPYLVPGESRRPTLTWPRQIPFDGEPTDVHEIVAQYAEWIPNSDVPKLFINADPGLIISSPEARKYARGFKNQQDVTVKGLHFLQEDSPDEIGVALAEWINALP